MVLSIFGSRSGTSATSGSGSATSGSGISAMFSHRSNTGRIVQAVRTQGLANYNDVSVRAPGDIFFHIVDDKAGHANMTAPDTTYKVDSVDRERDETGERVDGVRRIPLSRDRNPALVYRFHNRATALRAALLAEGWVGRVRYSDGAGGGTGLTFRAIGAALGSSHFGLGAMARLQKYRSRAGMAPKNLICSEMCILAYQLAMSEDDPDFIRLDAKHSTPARLMSYLDSSPYWALVAYRLPSS